jgi:hypothetical protein
MGLDKDRVSELRKLSADLKNRLDSTHEEIRRIQSGCRHQWSETVYDPVVHEAYTFEGDPPGTMGVDRRLPMYVPRTEEKRWKRTCRRCDLTEYTERTDTRIDETPRF